jgi:cyanophycin synthetase
MKVEIIRAFTGANVYSHYSVVMMELDLEQLKGKKTSEISGFVERLLQILPELAKHRCGINNFNDFGSRMKAGTRFNYTVQHVAQELMRLSEVSGRKEKTCWNNEKDDSRVVIETSAFETARYLMKIAVELVESAVNEIPYSIEDKIAKAKDIAADTELGPSAMTIVEAAERRNIPWKRLKINSLVQFGYGRNRRNVQAAMTDRTGIIGVDLAGNKDFTKQRLKEVSIPVPDGEIVKTEAEAIEAFVYMGAPVVIKPLDGRQGKGVSLNLKTTEEVIRAFRSAREYSRKVLVEELFEGKNYRVLVIDGKMVAASERVPCGVIGDGVHTLGDLIEIENQNPMRGEGHEKPLTKIKVDPIILATLEKAGWKLDDVPHSGASVSLCAGMNLSTGGTARDVTDEVHPDVKLMCERAARIIDLDICGVDLVFENISAPPPKEKGGIIELNAAPGLRMHAFPTAGSPRDVGGAIVEMLYPEGKSARIPIISITGTNGKTTTTRMISHILNDRKRIVGTTTSTGIFLNGEQIAQGDTTGPISAWTILSDKAVDAAVLETARGGIVRRGLAYDWSDIAVITNISEDHIGQDGIESIEDIINIKALVAERVKHGGVLILNADDETSARILERPKVKEVEKQVVFFSFDEENPRLREHLNGGGTAFVTKDNLIYEIIGKEHFEVIDARKIPVTFGGTADFQTANAMAAIAACRAFGLSREEIAKGLHTFRADVNNPGRNNLYKLGKGYVMVDYGHNTDGFAAISRMASHWHGRRLTGIINIAGDRADRIIKDAAKVAANSFHRVIATEDADRRGRAPGEIPRILCETVVQEKPDVNCEIVSNETEAVSKAISEMVENEVVVVFYDKLSNVLEILTQNGAVPVSSFDEAANQQQSAA